HPPRVLLSFPTRRSSDLPQVRSKERAFGCFAQVFECTKLDFQFTRLGHGGISTVERAIGLSSAAPTGKEKRRRQRSDTPHPPHRSEEHTSELQSRSDLVC